MNMPLPQNGDVDLSQSPPMYFVDGKWRAIREALPWVEMEGVHYAFTKHHTYAVFFSPPNDMFMALADLKNIEFLPCPSEYEDPIAILKVLCEEHLEIQQEKAALVFQQQDNLIRRMKKQQG